MTYDEMIAEAQAAHRAVVAERDQLRTQHGELWTARSQVHQLASEVVQLKRRADSLNRELQNARRDADFWRKALRYQQQLTKPARRVRHIPTFNSRQRRQCESRGWVNLERIFLKHWRKENRRDSGD
jgi:uncharacterized coiled-coil DUF342 family protein